MQIAMLYSWQNPRLYYKIYMQFYQKRSEKDYAESHLQENVRHGNLYPH